MVQQGRQGCILLCSRTAATSTVGLKDGVIPIRRQGQRVKEAGRYLLPRADAQRPGCCKSGSLYKTYPKIMYFNRAISGAQKTLCPGSLE